ncbi:hypothetical protein E6R31_24330 [Escherichia coli]|nr:hypothetical protein [Escherichia coli]EFB7402945.1 hypothetical protein [Escherichia coli]EFC4188776.1 hypothetical protein [Escherichia coli]
MMSLWDALRMNMMISYQELVRTFLNKNTARKIPCAFCPSLLQLRLHSWLSRVAPRHRRKALPW